MKRKGEVNKAFKKMKTLKRGKFEDKLTSVNKRHVKTHRTMDDSDSDDYSSGEGETQLGKTSLYKNKQMTQQHVDEPDLDEGSDSDSESGSSDVNDAEDVDKPSDFDDESSSDTDNQHGLKINSSNDEMEADRTGVLGTADSDDEEETKDGDDDDDDDETKDGDDDDDDEEEEETKDDDDDDEEEGEDSVVDDVGTAGENAIEKQYSAIRKELADIPFEDLLKIKEKVGVKAFNKIMQGNMEDKPDQKIFKRSNKHRPREMSSKRPVPFLKRKKESAPRTARDPRFDDLSGEFKDHHFNKNYSFIEDIKDKERETVVKKLKKVRNDNKKHELKGLLNRMQQEQQAKAMKQKKEDLEKTYREKEKELVKDGKTPFFLKKSDKKTLELAMKFKELKQSGGLDKYMSKKRKRVAQKQRKKMPSKQ